MFCCPSGFVIPYPLFLDPLLSLNPGLVVFVGLLLLRWDVLGAAVVPQACRCAAVRAGAAHARRDPGRVDALADHGADVADPDVRQLRHHFWTIFRAFLSSTPPPHALWAVLYLVPRLTL